MIDIYMNGAEVHISLLEKINRQTFGWRCLSFVWPFIIPR